MKPVRQIDYCQRSSFNEFQSEDHDFIRQFVQQNRIKTTLEVPCGNGRSLSIFSENVQHAYFGDINELMINEVNNKIKKKDLTNCSTYIMDLLNLSSLNIQVDAIFIMQQAIQMFSLNEITRILSEVRTLYLRYIIIDLFDFSTDFDDKPYYIGSKKTFEFTDCLGRTLIRNTEFDFTDNRVTIYHYYLYNNVIEYETKVNMYNYTVEEFQCILLSLGLRIAHVYSSYDFKTDDNSGRMLFVISK